MNRILSRALALVHTVIEYASIDGGRIIVGVRPWTSFGLRCPVCGRVCECYARSPRPRLWRAMDLARSNLSALGLHEMAASLPDYVRMVAAGERGFASALEDMTRVEGTAREVMITNQRIRSSGFPYVKGLADFDWDFQPSVPRAEIDELGYLDVGSAGADLLFQLISTRYEQRSTIITTNVGIGGWGRVLGDDVAASAIADRVCHHCHLVKIAGRSYRLKDLPRDGPVKQ